MYGQVHSRVLTRPIMCQTSTHTHTHILGMWYVPELSSSHRAQQLGLLFSFYWLCFIFYFLALSHSTHVHYSGYFPMLGVSTSCVTIAVASLHLHPRTVSSYVTQCCIYTTSRVTVCVRVYITCIVYITIYMYMYVSMPCTVCYYCN